MSRHLYILDNGHGEETLKKSSPVWKDGTQLHEYQFNRSVVEFLSHMLDNANIEYVVLVPEINDISLRERKERSRVIRQDSIYISIHSNQYPPIEKVNGFETHYYSEGGRKIAEVFQKHIGTLGNNRGVKKSGFYVLKYPPMLSVLTENGFYSNESECKRLLDPKFQYKIAEEHFNAIKELESLDIY